MKLVLLGTGGYFPTRRRQTACLMLPEIGVVLDAGTGIRDIGRHLATDRLDIFLSHAHLDHIAGLTYLLAVLPKAIQSRTTVRGQPAKLAAVREHLFAEPIFPVMPGIRFEALAEKFELPAGGTLTHFPLEHPGGSIGFRLDWPHRSMAYVTDTTARPGAAYIECVRGVDLLVHEAYFPTPDSYLPEETGHSSMRAVAELAAAAHVGRLILVHIDPLIEDDNVFDLPLARQIFPQTQLACDEMEVAF